MGLASFAGISPVRHPMLKRSGYAEIKRLGKGAFGYALLVQRSTTKEFYVAKMQKYRHLKTTDKECVLREVETMKRVSESGGHPHLVTFRQSFLEGSMLCIVMDFCNSGDLEQKISQQRAKCRWFEEHLVKIWLVQLLSATDYLHHWKVLHRDIKPANVFVHAGTQLKLGDLGLSKQHVDVTTANRHTMCGSPLYLAPEVHMGAGYSKSLDVWGLGCTLFEIMMLSHAFRGSDDEQVLRNIVDARHAEIKGPWAPPLCTLLKSMLTLEADKRPSALELLRQPCLRVARDTALDMAALAHRPGLSRERQAGVGLTEGILLQDKSPAAVPFMEVILPANGMNHGHTSSPAFVAREVI